MSITLQALQSDGTWAVRNAFVTENAKVISGSMKADDLEALARKTMAQWQGTAPDGKQLRVHNSATERSDRLRRDRRAETDARSKGWMTNKERHGVEDVGVVHPDGHWAADWQSAAVFHDAMAARV